MLKLRGNRKIIEDKLEDNWYKKDRRVCFNVVYVFIYYIFLYIGWNNIVDNFI